MNKHSLKRFAVGAAVVIPIALIAALKPLVMLGALACILAGLFIYIIGTSILEWGQ